MLALWSWEDWPGASQLVKNTRQVVTIYIYIYMNLFITTNLHALSFLSHSKKSTEVNQSHCQVVQIANVKIISCNFITR